MKGTWSHEFALWDSNNHVVQILHKGKDAIDVRTSVLILSYDLSIRKEVRIRLAQFLAQSPSLLIADEAHAIKSLKSVRTNVFLYALLPRAKHALLLTGTPMPNTVKDLYPLVYAAEAYQAHRGQPHLNGSKTTQVEGLHQFCEKYAYPMPTPYGDGLEYRGLRNVPQLKARLNQYMVRRFKKDVLKQLPKRIYSHLYLDIPKTLAEQSMEHVEAIRKSIIRNRIERDIRLPKYATFRRELGLIKLPSICNWLDDLFAAQPDTPIVLFSIHTDVIAGLNQYLQKKKIPYGEISGRISAKERTQVVDNFQKKELQCMNAQIVAGGVGITLTRASIILLTELPWSPWELDQAISRCHRIGQKKPLQIFFALAANSIDEAVIGTVRAKLEQQQRVLGKQ